MKYLTTSVRNRQERERCGKLYVVATPIGNMEDITLRAIRILSFVDIVIAEDTRLTMRLLSFYGIKTRFLSMHEHNEIVRIPQILRKIKLNNNIALVSNAGTPLISDPGFRLLQSAIDNSVKIIPIPGVSAVVASASVAGVPVNEFVFLGFPSRKKGKRLKQLKEAFFEKRTTIFYESPRRIVSLLCEIVRVLKDPYVVLSREITKIHEEFIRGKASVVLKKLRSRDKIRGECTLLISGYSRNSRDNVHLENIPGKLPRACSENGPYTTMGLAKKLSVEYRLPKREIYNMITKIKKNMKF